ncbi:MAG: hypothetical protein OJF52_002968 [Nitrospira sp.]|nr:MAG: hypothetical protein OJF52_002968 [Nitrospira sp.]
MSFDLRFILGWNQLGPVSVALYKNRQVAGWPTGFLPMYRRALMQCEKLHKGEHRLLP